MTSELYCELTPLKPVYKELRDGLPYAYGRFYGNNCHIAWGIRSRLKEDLTEVGNERVYFYRYWKAGNIFQDVSPAPGNKIWTKGGDVWSFSRQQCANIEIISKFDGNREFEVQFELRANHRVQFFIGADNDIRYVKDVLNCQRSNLEMLPPFKLKKNERINIAARPTFLLPKSADGKSEAELNDDEKYLWMEFYRATIYTRKD